MLSRRNLYPALFLAWLACAGTSTRVRAQAPAGSIKGRIFIQFPRSPRHGISAVVWIKDSKGNKVKGVWSDQDGRYAINGVAPGNYILDVTKTYFVEQERTINLRAGKSVSLNVVLKPPPPESDCPSVASTPPFPVDMVGVRITFERFTCMGACPGYTIDISGDGGVKYVGIVNVQHMGPLSYTIPLDRVRRLTKMFYRKDFFSLCRKYSVSWTDLPGTHTSIDIGGTRWAVDDYGLVGPKRLKSLDEFIDKLAGPPTTNLPQKKITQ